MNVDKPDTAKFFSSIPLLSLFLLFLLTHAGSLVLFAYDRPIPPEAYRPLENMKVLLSVAAITMLNASVILLALTLIRSITSRLHSIVSWIALTILCLTLLSTSQYYVYFGGFPSYEVIKEFLANPLVTSGYASSAIGWYDYSVLIALTLLLTFPSYFIVRDLRGIQRSLPALSFSLVLVAGTFYLSKNQLNRTKNSITMGMASQNMSLPVKFWSELLIDNADNNIELASNYIPKLTLSTSPVDFSKPKNIIVFIVDCARADHLPFYGYERNTFPNLFAQKDDWIVFSRFYAHGPTTSVSIPVLLNSNYLAGIHRQGINARIFWNSLTVQNYRSAYINSATLKWGNIEGLAGVDLLDFYFTADHDQDDRVIISDTAYDFNIRDAKLLAKYSEFLEQSEPNPTMAFVHLNAAHFPYHSEDSTNIFAPFLDATALSQGREQIASTESTDKILNSYDNSLVYVDKLLQQYVSLLKSKGLLENSVLMVTADHGEGFREHGYLFHNTGIFNELVKVPLLVRVGTELPALKDLFHKNKDNVGGLVDVVPTVASLVGGKLSRSYHGRSILLHEPKPYELIFYKFLVEEFAVVKEHKKFIYSLNSRQAFYFDLGVDPNETRNLWIKPVGNFESFLNVLESKNILER